MPSHVLIWKSLISVTTVCGRDVTVAWGSCIGRPKQGERSLKQHKHHVGH